MRQSLVDTLRAPGVFERLSEPPLARRDVSQLQVPRRDPGLEDLVPLLHRQLKSPFQGRAGAPGHYGPQADEAEAQERFDLVVLGDAAEEMGQRSVEPAGQRLQRDQPRAAVAPFDLTD